MDIFLDTNIILDVLAERRPLYEASSAIWTLCEQGKISGHISVISFNNVFYIVRKLKGAKPAQRVMGLLRDVFQPVTLDPQLLNQAIGAGMSDFEDAIQYHSAIRAGAEHLITRNVSHFPKAAFPIITPEDFLAAQFPEI